VRLAGTAAGTAELAPFGLRPSDFFRISGFGFRALPMSLFHSELSWFQFDIELARMFQARDLGGVTLAKIRILELIPKFHLESTV
jgi:hypothetical protein